MGKYIIIKTKKEIFISDNVQGKDYFNSEIPSLLFDDMKLVATYKKDWYKIGNIPKSVKKKSSDTYINSRYELKEGYPISELTPKVLQYIDEDDDIRGLYTNKTDKIEGDWIEIDFEVDLLSEEDSFYVEKPKYQFTSSIMSQIIDHPALREERPSFISGKEFYKIIRSYIKTHLDGKYAKITSDYDFCLAVEKVIELTTPQSYKVDLGTKRRPKLETRFNKNKQVVIFKSSPEGYNDYPTQNSISGKNYKDLEEKVNIYLTELITKINEPLKECTCCNGTGIIIN